MTETARTITARFLTASRGDLFAMTRQLLAAVAAADLPCDSSAPLMIGVNGSLQSGKKIIADAAVEMLFDPGSAAMEGKAGYDEYWRGTRGGASFEVDYIDMAYPYRADYSPRLATLRPLGRGQDNSMDLKFMDFCAMRTAPGVTFVQNPSSFGERCGITLYIENRSLQVPVGYKVPRLHLAPNSLKTAFASLSGGNDWARLVEIEIRDQRLLVSPAFGERFIPFAPYCRVPDLEHTGVKKWHKRLQKMALIDQEIEPRGIRADVHIFGRNFPHAAGPS